MPNIGFPRLGDAAGVSTTRTRGSLRWGPTLTAALSLSTLLAVGTSSATELRDAELVAGGSPALLNGTGTVRLEDARLGRIGPAALILPEPGAVWQLTSGIGLLAFLAGRRRRRTPSDLDAGAPARADPTTPRRRLP